MKSTQPLFVSDAIMCVVTPRLAQVVDAVGEVPAVPEKPLVSLAIGACATDITCSLSLHVAFN